MKNNIKSILNTLTPSTDYYIVGGYIRDKLINVKSSDIDIEIYNISTDEFEKCLEHYTLIKSKFFTYKIKEVPNLEFAFPRTEIKTGSKYNDYEINLTNDLYTATLRRDYTVNAIMYNIKTNEIIDFHNGLLDLENLVLKHITLNFMDDPFRIFRGIRLVALHNFKFDNQTLNLCIKMSTNIFDISQNRLYQEILKILSGKYLEIAIVYFYKIFNDSLTINPDIINLYKSTSIEHKVLLLNYYIDNPNFIELFPKNKNIRLFKSTNFTDLNAKIRFFNTFNDKIVMDTYKILFNQDISKQLDYFNELKDKFSNQYFIEQGIAKDIDKYRMELIYTEMSGGENNGSL